MFCLDTNTLIHYFKGQGGVAETLLAMPPNEVGIPTVVAYELLVGIRKSSAKTKRLREFQGFLSSIHTLPFAMEEAKEAADIRVQLEAIGTPIGPIDTLIAATARVHNAVLISRNVKEFSRVKGLQVKSWYQE